MIGFLMERYLKGYAARTILDLGPGYGEFGRVAASLTEATEITFLDCNQEVLDWQTDEYKKAGLTAVAVRKLVSVEALSELNGPFDLILCQEVLEHLSNAEEILSALVDQMKSDGRIVITVPTKLSECWLKWLNPSYMRDDPHGHVRQFNKEDLMNLFEGANLCPVAFVPTQPHYFLAHTWLFGTRMKVEGSTGKVLTTKGLRAVVLRILHSHARRFFAFTGPELWGRLLPRNYFVVAKRARSELTQ